VRHFCTLFNAAYKYHAHLLHDSIARFYNKAQFYFFCFDEDSYEYFLKLNFDDIILIRSSELEHTLYDLKQVKASRTIAEYFFTCTPATCKYVVEKFPLVDEIVYLDADLYFYQSPEAIFEEGMTSSISIIPHKFNLINYYKNVYGYYNVGWVSFKNNNNGLACLNKWYADNIKWCYDKLTINKYADQKYLNYWKKDFKGVCIINHKGANVAPWNVSNHKISLRDSMLYIDDAPIIFYHFASLKFIDGSYYTTISSYFGRVKPNVAELIYQPYIRALGKLGYKPRISERLNKKFLVSRLRKLIRNYYGDYIKVDL